MTDETRVSFLTILKHAKTRNRSEEKYLLCKAAIVRRQQQVGQRRELGLDTHDLERMIERLRESMAAHKRAIRNREKHNRGL